MSATAIVLTILGWSLIGFAALVYAYKRERFIPPLLPGLLVGAIAGLFGPLMWLVVWDWHLD